MKRSKWIFLPAPNSEAAGYGSADIMAKRVKHAFQEGYVNVEQEVYPAHRLGYMNDFINDIGDNIGGCAFMIDGHDIWDLMGTAEEFAMFYGQSLEIMIDSNNYMREEADPRTYYEHGILGSRIPLEVIVKKWQTHAKEFEHELAEAQCHITKTDDGIVLFGNYPGDNTDTSDVIRKIIAAIDPLFGLGVTFELVCSNSISELPLANQFVQDEKECVTEAMPFTPSNEADDLPF